MRSSVCTCMCSLNSPWKMFDLGMMLKSVLICLSHCLQAGLLVGLRTLVSRTHIRIRATAYTGSRRKTVLMGAGYLSGGFRA